MRINRFTVAAIAAAIAVTGCAKKPPKDLPPPPGSGSEIGSGQTGGDQSGGVGNAVVPGSRADFLQSVPSDRIFFDTDSYTVDDEDRPILNAQAAWLQRHPNVRVTVEGHADERGTREYNLALGDRRANAAKNYLAGQGIDVSRMTTISYGKERPVALGSDEEAWAKNRRAVTIIPD
jgi:peptidoglycan-associated lipoprotein